MMSSLFFIGMALLPMQLLDKIIIPFMILSSLRFGSFVGLFPSFIDISPTYQDSLITLRFERIKLIFFTICNIFNLI